MQIDWTAISRVLVELVLVPILGYATLCFRAWIKTKIANLQEKTKSELTKKYLDMLDSSVYECVLATNQTFVDALKKTGTFNEETQKEAFSMTFSAVKAMLSDEAMKYLGEAFNDLDAYITNKIEAQIKLNH